LKLVAEPGGAVALAAILSGAFPLKGRTVAIVLSGGNIDPQLFSEIICEGQETALSRP
jgi:threonine dehydratase